MRNEQMNRFFSVLACVLIIVLGLAACGAPAEAELSGAAQPEATAVPEQESSAEPEESDAAQQPAAGDDGAVYMGVYEQDNDTANGPEPIAWIVLKEEDGRKLLISKYCLDAMAYHNGETTTTWAECSLREWLNDAFLTSAFTEEEQSQIQTVTLENPDSVITRKDYDGSEKTTVTESCGDTEDRIFLLSVEEVEEYLPAEEERIAMATEYAIAQRRSFGDQKESIWWLRSIGMLQDRAMNIQQDGTVETRNPVYSGTFTVRPAMWISAS